MVQAMGSQLRQKRLELHLSICQLARLSGVNRNLISAIERNMTPSSYEPIERLANALGVSSEELTAGE
jgi:transcriptional regulator with XRE-family HTH domain